MHHMSESPSITPRMSQGAYGTPEDTSNGGHSVVVSVSDLDVRRCLMQFILQCNGVVSESWLLSCFLALEYDAKRLSRGDVESLEPWRQKLGEHIRALNVQLRPINYKIAIINHPMGKRYVGRNFQNPVQDLVDTNWTESGKLYVYVNLKYDAQLTLATLFSAKDIAFVKWAIEMMFTSGSYAQPFERGDYGDGDGDGNGDEDAVVNEVDQVLREKYGDMEYKGLATFVSYRIGSGALMHTEQIPPSRIEQVLAELYQKKWVNRYPDGKIGLAVRFMVEMKDYLVENFDIPLCITCKEVVLQGVICLNCREEFNHGWHVGCLAHHVQHVNEKCPSCNTSLQESCAYVLG